MKFSKLANSNFTMNVDYDLSDNHIKVTKLHLDTPTVRSYFKFDNLFNGNKQLGDEMNKFMNENWLDVAKDTKPSFDETLDRVFKQNLDNLFEKVPYDEIFV